MAAMTRPPAHAVLRCVGLLDAVLAVCAVLYPLATGDHWSMLWFGLTFAAFARWALRRAVYRRQQYAFWRSWAGHR